MLPTQFETIRRIVEIERYISDLIEVKKNINKTEVKFELFSSYQDKITLTFTDPFFNLEMKQKFIADYVDRAIDYYQAEYLKLKQSQK